MTSSPDFVDPPKRPPFLIANGATPDLRAPIHVKDITMESIAVSASVTTFDTRRVDVELIIDYGHQNALLQKGRCVLRGKAILPTTNDATVSIAQATLPPGACILAPGCHTATLLVTHQLGGRDGSDIDGCPTRLCDSSQLTWRIDVACTDACADCEEPTDTCPSQVPSDASALELAKIVKELPCTGDDPDAGPP